MRQWELKSAVSSLPAAQRDNCGNVDIRQTLKTKGVNVPRSTTSTLDE